MSDMQERATLLLKAYYNLDSDHNIPPERPISEWLNDNKQGFFLGLIQHGREYHVSLLYDLLRTNQFESEQVISNLIQLADPRHSRTFIDNMLAYYIHPFIKKYIYDSSSCQNSSSPEKRHSPNDEQTPKKTHRSLTQALQERDKACLFCWERVELKSCHIIAQEDIPMPNNEDPLLQQAGLEQKHQVQNGLFICIMCHDDFNDLRIYVESEDDRMVVKVIDKSNGDDPNCRAHRDWKDVVKNLTVIRTVSEEYRNDGRNVVEPDGEFILYFVDYDPAKLPNRKALAFQKAACLIWRLAGGAIEEEEYCSDDDDYGGYRPVGGCQSKNIDKWQDTSATVTRDGTQ